MSKKKNKNKVVKKVPAPKQQPTYNSFWSNTAVPAVIIFFAAFFPYSNTLMHQYAQDDAIVIYDNMYTKQGLKGIPGIWSKDTFFGFFKKEGKAQLVSGGRYRPMTLVMFAMEWELFGDQPFVGHLLNVVYFALTCLVLYWLLLLLFRHDKKDDYAVWVAFFTALLFAVHPIHTEAVANIKGRDEIITLLGSLSALYFSLLAFRRKNQLFNLLAGVLFFIAIFSKENAITFLAIVPLTYLIFTKASFQKIAIQLLPFIIPTVIFLLKRKSALGIEGLIGVGSTPTLELMNNPFVKIVDGQYTHFTVGERMATIFYTMGKYFQLLVFPYPLTHDYYPRHVEMMSFSNWKVILSVIGYVGAFLSAVYFAFAEKSRMAFAVLFYLITLSIVSNFVFPIGTNMAERLLFMPSVGFCLFVVLRVIGLFDFQSNPEFTSGATKIPTYLMTGVAVIFALLTFNRNFAWENNYTLFKTDIKTSTNSAKLLNAMGGELLVQSVDVKNEGKRQSMIKEAVGHLEQAVKIHPNYKNAYLLLGNANNYLKDFERSIQYYQKAIALDPNYEDAQSNLAITYREGGQYFGEKKNDLAKAFQYLNEAYRLNPNDSETVRLLGVANGVAQRHQEAINFFTKFTQLEPENAKGFYNLGSAYFNAGDAALGQQYHQKAIGMDAQVVEKMRSGG